MSPRRDNFSNKTCVSGAWISLANDPPRGWRTVQNTATTMPRFRRIFRHEHRFWAKDERRSWGAVSDRIESRLCGNRWYGEAGWMRRWRSSGFCERMWWSYGSKEAIRRWFFDLWNHEVSEAWVNLKYKLSSNIFVLFLLFLFSF